MSVNDLDELLNSVPANPNNIHGNNNVLVYDICQKKYFFISALQNKELLQKGMNPSVKVIDDNFSNKTSNDVNLSIKKELSSSVNISKDEQFGNASEKKDMVHNSTSNFVFTKNQQDNNYVSKYISLCNAGKDSTEEVSSSNNKYGAVVRSSLPPKSTITPVPKQIYTCHDCQNVFYNNYLRALHKCTALKSFECQSCSTSFPNTYSLYRHKQSNLCSTFYMGEKTLIDRFLGKELRSNNKLDTVGESNISNESATTPTLSQVNICNVCHKVFDTRCLHKCTSLKSFDCESCKLSFPNSYALNRHKQVHTNEKLYIDSQSNEVSNSVHKLTTVVETSLSNDSSVNHSESKTFVCNFCQKVFDTHCRHKCTALKSFDRESCKLSFPNSYALNRHKQVHTNEKPYIDSQSNEVSNSEHKLTTVVETSLSNESPVNHSESKTFTCNFCQKVYDKCYHLALHSCNKKYECESCNKKFPSYSKLKEHRQIHADGNRYKCSLCDRAFFDRSNLRRHSRVHTGEKPFGCDICNKRFAGRYNLKKHIKNIHVNKKQHAAKKNSKLKKKFICNICHNVFPRKKHLFDHFRTHTGEKPYECDICQKKFGEHGSLKIHMRVHTGEKPFVCDVCNSQFNHRSSLKIHIMDVHMGNDAYVCDICNESFSKRHSFVTHSRIHKGEKPHVCPSCGEGFSHIKDLRKHQLLHYDESAT